MIRPTTRMMLFAAAAMFTQEALASGGYAGRCSDPKCSDNMQMDRFPTVCVCEQEWIPIVIIKLGNEVPLNENDIVYRYKNPGKPDYNDYISQCANKKAGRYISRNAQARTNGQSQWYDAKIVATMPDGRYRVRNIHDKYGGGEVVSKNNVRYEIKAGFEDHREVIVGPGQVNAHGVRHSDTQIDSPTYNQDQLYKMYQTCNKCNGCGTDCETCAGYGLLEEHGMGNFQSQTKRRTSYESKKTMFVYHERAVGAALKPKPKPSRMVSESFGRRRLAELQFSPDTFPPFRQLAEEIFLLGD